MNPSDAQQIPSLIPLNQWLPHTERPLVVAGPCSAESPEQVLTTARQIAETGKVSVFRAGVWKPRSRPKTFEGQGEDALKWMQEVRQETGLLTAIEVATPAHIEQALLHQIDILWIGARTCVNPFSVQEIANALRGVDIPVMVKNPVNPDLQLWIGVMERFANAGINKLIAVHRGFYSFEKTPYRNAPVWDIPIELKSLWPNLPVICDPSHIAGNTHLLQSISQRAMDLNYDGLMIETHCNPEQALTDARQQITPQELLLLINNLILRQEQTHEASWTRLQNLRDNIDIIDEELLRILSKRLDMVAEIGKHKKKNSITILQIERWNSILKNRLLMGDKLGLRPEFLKKILALVHQESIHIQNQIMNLDEE